MAPTLAVVLASINHREGVFVADCVVDTCVASHSDIGNSRALIMAWLRYSLYRVQDIGSYITPLVP
jgi:hypothetical protein